MARRFVLQAAVLAALVLVPAAGAAFPAPYAAQGGDGVLSPDGSLRFVATAVGDRTVVSATGAEGGQAVATRMLAGSLGVPMATQAGPADGMFRDGSTFVLETVGNHATTRFVLLDTKTLAVRDTIDLRGTFALDALSPDSKRMYLIQHSTVEDIQHYVVRAYDLSTHTLLPGRVADKTQKSWVMQGWATSRVSTTDGRWVYTLYANPGGFPFIHALDTVRGVAHCIGIPWPQTDGNQAKVFSYVLALNGTTLSVGPRNGDPYRRVDTTTWKVTKPPVER
jgi:hypothetical protein